MAKPKSSGQNKFTTSFEEKTFDHLKAQDLLLERVCSNLERVEKKLESPVMNGGFETLLGQTTRIKDVNEELKKMQAQQGEKIDAIHGAIYDPEKGIYSKVKDHGKWIEKTGGLIKGIITFLGTSLVIGLGKLLYDIFQGHIHYTQ